MKNLTTRTLLYILLVCAVSLSNRAFSQDVIVASAEKTPVVAPTEDAIVTEGEKKEAKDAEGEEEEDGKLTVSGYLDSYFFHNFNNPASRDNMGQSGVG